MSRPGRDTGPMGIVTNRFVIGGVVLIALAGLYAAAGTGIPVRLGGSAETAAATRVPVTSALMACPGPGSGSPTGGGVAVASVPASRGQGSGQNAGNAVVTALTPGGSTGAGPALHSVSGPGQLATVGVPDAPVPLASNGGGTAVPTSPGRGGVVITAAGSMARGFDAEQLTSSGQVTARCVAPGTSFWFISPAGLTTEFSLYLMNTDSQPATVTVTALTDSGPVLGRTDAGVAVPPHAMVTQSLGALLRAARVVAVNVTTSTGRVAAAVRESAKPGKPGSWLPATLPPVTRQVLPGLPGSPGTGELYVAVPGATGAQVKVTAVTARGSYQPAGSSGFSVPGSSVIGIPLSSLAGLAAAVTVSANVPVTAVMVVPGGDAAAAGAFAAGALPLTQQGVIAASPVGAGGSSLLVLSAPGRAATVRLTVGGSLAGQPGQLIQVPAGHSVVVRLSRPPGSRGTSAVALVLTPQPGSGPVYAARVASAGGTVQYILPAVISPASVELPGVRSSLSTVLQPGSPGPGSRGLSGRGPRSHGPRGR